ncbi:hypothetical protein DPMN_011854 [Dreissena polymorpha]|uniref:Uncharacterized protein n=1 Tax=Dreissena polymorpha TaxID=45954 RepID=A0A9D4N6X3_DREPO|nr:hypothetical protein DPMN_011854 [Dreissena polymorpha]
MFNIWEAASKRVGFAWRSYDVQFRLRQEVSAASLAVINTDLWWHYTLSGNVLSVPSRTETPKGQGVGTSYPCLDYNWAPALGLFVDFPIHVPIVVAVTQRLPASKNKHCH